MGLLTLGGKNFHWDEIKKWADHVKKHGIIQFIHIYNKTKDRALDSLKWGDEHECTMVRLDHRNKRAQLLLKCSELLPLLQETEVRNPGQNPTEWRVEFTEYQVEGSPGQPYGGCMRHFNIVEANLKLRRQELQSVLTEPGETFIAFATFPLLGCPNFTFPPIENKPSKNPFSRSIYLPDEIISQIHPRFGNLTRTPRERLGRRVQINMPVFKDENTPDPFLETFPGNDAEAKIYSKPNHVYMDSVCFGFGCCCLQVTFQGCNINESRILYDQLAALGPIMLALSAATPACKGYLLDTDCRWQIIEQACDDRTEEEKGNEPLMNHKFVIPKSRYGSIDMYLSPEGAKYNDAPILYEQEHYDMLVEAGIDSLLAQHIAHLFIRDPVSLFEDRLNVDDENDLEHFENIQSTNWQTVRFKPPPPGANMGWRVEFRPMESQLTDFENAAYVTFIVLLTRVILSYNLNMLMPISKMEENMEAAVKRDAVLEGKFHFRKDLQKCLCSYNCSCDDDEYELMSVDTIINGKTGEFPGLVPLINSYLDNVDVDIDTRCSISQYLRLIQSRASGELMTTAHWMRQFIRSHPKYKKDSVITEEIMYDLACKADQVSNGNSACPELFASPLSKTSDFVPEQCRRLQAEVDEFRNILLMGGQRNINTVVT